MNHEQLVRDSITCLGLVHHPYHSAWLSNNRNLMIEQPEISFGQSMELFLVNNQLVARQQSYTHAYMKEGHREVKHYYCPCCGTVWGLRVDPDATSPRHYYYKSKCHDCGGAENMLTPWEQENLWVLGPNVLAYLILTTDPGDLS